MFGVFMGCVYLLSRVKYLMQKLSELKDSIIASTFWNGIIQSVAISYLNLCLQAYATATSDDASENY